LLLTAADAWVGLRCPASSSVPASTPRPGCPPRCALWMGVNADW